MRHSLLSTPLLSTGGSSAKTAELRRDDIREALERGRQQATIPKWRIVLQAFLLMGSLSSVGLASWRVKESPAKASTLYKCALTVSLMASVSALSYACYQIHLMRRKLRALREGRFDERNLGAFGELLFQRSLEQRARTSVMGPRIGANDKQTAIVESFFLEHQEQQARLLRRKERKALLRSYTLKEGAIEWVDRAGAGALAAGDRCEIRRVRLRNRGEQLFAAKVMLADKVPSSKIPAVLAGFQREASIMCKLDIGAAQLRDPSERRTVRVEGLCQDMRNPVLVMEYAARGSLRAVLDEAIEAGHKGRGSFGSSGGAAVAAAGAQGGSATLLALGLGRSLRAAADIAAGLAQMYCNDPPVCHRDLCSANVLVNTSGECLIGDFGLSATCEPVVDVVSTDITTVPVGELTVGAPPYSAPEYLEKTTDWTQKRQAQAADVYGFGVILWEIVTGAVPWEGTPVMELIQAVRQGHRPPLPEFPPDSIGQRLCEIMLDCWAKSWSTRPGFEHVLHELAVLTKEYEKMAPKDPSQVDMEIASRAARSAKRREREEKVLATSDTRKYHLGQPVYNIGNDLVNGIVTKVKPTMATPDGKTAGSVTIAVYRLRIMDTSHVTKYRVGGRAENLGHDRVSGIVVNCTATTPAGDSGPGQITIFLD